MVSLLFEAYCCGAAFLTEDGKMGPWKMPPVVEERKCWLAGPNNVRFIYWTTAFWCLISIYFPNDFLVACTVFGGRYGGSLQILPRGHTRTFMNVQCFLEFVPDRASGRLAERLKIADLISALCSQSCLNVRCWDTKPQIAPKRFTVRESFWFALSDGIVKHFSEESDWTGMQAIHYFWGYSFEKHKRLTEVSLTHYRK